MITLNPQPFIEKLFEKRYHHIHMKCGHCEKKSAISGQFLFIEVTKATEQENGEYEKETGLYFFHSLRCLLLAVPTEGEVH